MPGLTLEMVGAWFDVKIMDKENLDIKYVNKFLGLLAFEIWYRIFITKEMREDATLST